MNWNDGSEDYNIIYKLRQQVKALQLAADALIDAGEDRIGQPASDAKWRTAVSAARPLIKARPE